MCTPRLPLLAFAVLAAACNAAPDTDAASAGDVAALRGDIAELTSATRELQASLRTQERRLARLERQPVGAVTGSSSGAAAESAGAATTSEAEAGEAPVDPSAAATDDEELADLPPGTVKELLSTESGRQAMQKAADSAARKQAQRQRDTLVAYELARFGREAGLTEQQTDDLQTIWKETIADVRKALVASRAAQGGTDEEKAQARQAVMQSMRDLAAQRTDRVRGLLDDDQFALYEKREKEIDAALHGAPPSRPSTDSKEARVAK